MNNPDLAQLSRFVACAQKRLDLPLLAGCFADRRPQPDIPARAVGFTMTPIGHDAMLALANIRSQAAVTAPFFTNALHNAGFSDPETQMADRNISRCRINGYISIIQGFTGHWRTRRLD